MTARIALVTSAAGRPLDDDLPPLAAALAAAGAAVDTPDWRDATVDWGAYDRAVIRSTWDYIDHLEEFLDWTLRCAERTDLVNPPPVVRWNCDKRYLAELADAGVRVVETSFVADPDAARDAELPAHGEFVVKPAVSVGSRDAVRYSAAEHARARDHLASLVAAGRVAMIQPYQSAVDAEGETALLFFGGQLSHAIGKAALLEPGGAAHTAMFAPERVTAAEPTVDQREAAERCLGALGGIPALAGLERPPAYARVDVLRDNDGGTSVLELELIEPSVFFDFAPDGAAERFARVILEGLER